MKRHRVRGFQHGTDVPARSAPLGIGSAIESKEKKLAPALRIIAHISKPVDIPALFTTLRQIKDKRA